MTVEVSENKLANSRPKDKAEDRTEFLPRTLQEAIHTTVHHSDIPPKTIAESLGISYQQLCNVSNPNLPFKFSSRHLESLMKISGNDLILEYLAQRRGYILFKIPPQKVNTGDFLQAAFRVQDLFAATARSWRGFFTENAAGKREALEKFIESCDVLLPQFFRSRSIAKALLNKEAGGGL